MEELQKFLQEQGITEAQLAEFAKTPEGRKLLELQYAKTKSPKLKEAIAPLLEVALAGADVVRSAKQIRDARKAARGLSRPGMPVPPQLDPLYDQQINRALDSGVLADKLLAPTKAELADTYQADLNAANVASSGQAGAYGAYAQAANLNRGRNAARLGAQRAQIENSLSDRAANLVAAKQSAKQDIFRGLSSLVPYEQQAYTQDATAVGNLMATGNQNLRNSLNTLLPEALNYGTDLYAMELAKKNAKYPYQDPIDAKYSALVKSQGDPMKYYGDRSKQFGFEGGVPKLPFGVPDFGLPNMDIEYDPYGRGQLPTSPMRINQRRRV